MCRENPPKANSKIALTRFNCLLEFRVSLCCRLVWASCQVVYYIARIHIDFPYVRFDFLFVFCLFLFFCRRHTSRVELTNQRASCDCWWSFKLKGRCYFRFIVYRLFYRLNIHMTDDKPKKCKFRHLRSQKSVNLTIDLFSLDIFAPGTQVFTYRPQKFAGSSSVAVHSVPVPKRRVKRFRCFRIGRR